MVGSAVGANRRLEPARCRRAWRRSRRCRARRSVRSIAERARRRRAGEQRERHGEQRRRGDERPAGDAQRPPPAVEAAGAGAAPEPFASQSRVAAVHRREHRADRADAAAGDEIDADAGFVQRAQHAGVVRARRARSGQHERGAQPRRVQPVRRVRRDHDAGSDVGRDLFVVDREQLDDLEPLAAVRRRDDDLVAFFLVEERAADRRRGRDQPCSTSASSGITS